MSAAKRKLETIKNVQRKYGINYVPAFHIAELEATIRKLGNSNKKLKAGLKNKETARLHLVKTARLMSTILHLATSECSKTPDQIYEYFGRKAQE